MFTPLEVLETEPLPVPLEEIDCERHTRTSSTFRGENYILDTWDGVSADDTRALSEPWTGEVLFPLLNVESDMDKFFGKTREQKTTRPGNVDTIIWGGMSGKQRKDAKDYWSRVLSARDTRRLSKLQCWTRADPQARVHVGTTQDGPQWAHVHRRVVTDATTGQLLLDQDVRGMTNKGILYARVAGGPRDIITRLYHDDPNLPDTAAVPAAEKSAAVKDKGSVPA